MCGICGKLIFDREANLPPGLIRAMTDSIRHRGPDDDGYYVSGPVGFGFRRLSIIDLSTGHQPISNENGSVWVVFNGEIYNYQELRRQLLTKGHVFKTETDTEVLVHLYEECGPEFVKKLRGMFSFALWDEPNQTLLLARDRVGIKPLYYYRTDHFLSFGSEMKAILADPAVERKIKPTIIDRFLSFYYVPGEETLFENLFKLPPGTYLISRNGRTEIRPYWDLRFDAGDSHSELQKAEKELLDLLDETVGLHLISDVPLGFLLSGGLDSTAMLSFAAGKVDRPISSYTVGFTAAGIVDERPYALLAAEKFGTKHYDITISAEDFLAFLPSYVWHMEEPVCEPPAIALYYVSKLASNYVKVLISGEGGDEAFAGYSNYRNLLWLERIKTALGPTGGAIGNALLGLNKVVRSKRVAKYAPLFGLPLESYYYSRTSTPFNFFNSHAQDLYADGFADCISKDQSVSVVQKCLKHGDHHGVLNKMLFVDTKTWLPDDLLVKADKMTMANSVELRVPFLDHKILEFAASLPTNFKLRRFTTKYLAKRALSSRLPKEILARRKAGFPVPYGSWLRTDLKKWLVGVLLDRETLERGYFAKKAIRQLIDDDLRSGGYSKEIFSLAILELWHRAFLKKESPTNLEGEVCRAERSGSPA